MNSSFEELIFDKKNLKEVNNFLEREKQVYISKLYGSSKLFFVKELFKSHEQIVILFPNVLSVQEFCVELAIVGLNDYVIQINDLLPENIQEKLANISKLDQSIIVSTFDLLRLQLPSKKIIDQYTTTVSIGGNLTYNDLIDYFNLLNYKREQFTEAMGDFSQRGSIIDFWSFSEKMPVRLEFDGDFIESVRYFDPDSQRSIEMIESATIAPAYITQENMRVDENIFSYLNNPILLASNYELENFFSVKEVVNDKVEIDLLDSKDYNELMTEISPDGSSSQSPINTTPNASLDLDFTSVLSNENSKWILEVPFSQQCNINFRFSEAPTIRSNFKILSQTITEYAENNFSIYITTENELQSKRLLDLFSELDINLESLIEKGKIKIVALPIKEGFVNKEKNILVFTDYQIFSKPYRTKISSTKKKKNKNKDLASLKIGDFIVHEDYGIGKFLGLQSIKIGETEQESMKILYSEAGIVYVNLNYLHLVKKFSSKDGVSPQLAELGTSHWENTKKRAKKKIKEAARALIILYAKRKSTKGFAFAQDTIWQKELEASFIYEDTPDQAKVSEEVKEDMQSENPMDRLVCGDVGFGKTEIAVRAAFKAVQDNKQVALLVPTTILAEQHYNTFKDRLSQFAVKIEALSRFQTKAEQKKIVNELAEGRVDIVIGTHRLISKDVSFKNIGLLIIDEEHRFGVMVKEKLRELRVNIDTLTLTATPIPRTLNLSLLGARDLSIIATPPPNRQPIYTLVDMFDISKIRTWINTELNRDGQIYFVHDRVQSIDKLASYLLKFMPDLKIGIAHGQMKPSQLEDVIHGFQTKKYNVLLSTKIIESGIDIPNVNTIIVNRADRFGLAELHQLRGRVGRSDRQAYAYFLVPSLSAINKKALRRLEALEEFTDVGEGFNLSMRDLEIRGAGNLLGSEQTGFIDEIGFDLYVKLINQAVEELKYEEFKEVFKNLPKSEIRTEPIIDTYFEIGIPNNYMTDASDRLSFYTALYGIKNLAELSEIVEEIKDRFGDLPILAKRLIRSAELKHCASYALFTRVAIQRKNIFIILPREQDSDYYKFKFTQLMKLIMSKYTDKIKFQQTKDIMKLIIVNNFESPEIALDFLISFCNEVSQLNSEQK